MAKKNLDTISLNEAVSEVNIYQRHKMKSHGLNDDPYVTTYDILRKFICSEELATSIISILINRNTRRSCYFEHFLPKS